MDSENRPLHICQDLFETLNTKQIKYCHWKSNFNLDFGLIGKTDLDLLVAKDDKDIFLKVLNQLAIKKVNSQPAKQFPGLEDYIGFDNATGELIHLHLHYELVLGEKHIKNHRLPLENWLLSNTRIHSGVKIPVPEAELFILLIRSHLKLDFIPVRILKYFLQGNVFPDDIIEDYNFLFKDVNWDSFCRIVDSTGFNLNTDYLIEYCQDLLNNKIGIWKPLYMRRYWFRILNQYQRYYSWQLWRIRLKSLFQNNPLTKKLLKFKGKTLPGKGRSFALVGADGAGKSSLLRDLSRWLSWKLEVRKHYMGIPKTYTVRLFQKSLTVIRLMGFTAFYKTPSSWQWLFIARKRLQNSKTIHTEISKGEIALIDRWPLKEFHSMDSPMDGPRIRSEKGTDKYAIIEEGIYEELIFPDNVFILKTDIEQLRKRKNDLSYDSLLKKANAINALPSSKYQIIDGNNDYPDVLLEIKRKIWKQI